MRCLQLSSLAACLFLAGCTGGEESKISSTTTSSTVTAPAGPVGQDVLAQGWRVQELQGKDAAGKAFNPARDLRGKVWVGGVFFLNCKTMCPVIFAKLAEVQSSLGSPSIPVVGFSVDPERDTPAQLQAYQEANPRLKGLQLITGYTGAEIETFCRGFFKMDVSSPKPTGPAPTDHSASGSQPPIIHGSNLYLVNQDGIIVKYYDLKSSSSQKIAEEIAGDAKRLQASG